MPLYKLSVVFKIRRKIGEVTQKKIEKIEKFKDISGAERAFASQISRIVIENSSSSIEWVVYKQCVTNA